MISAVRIVASSRFPQPVPHVHLTHLMKRVMDVQQSSPPPHNITDTRLARISFPSPAAYTSSCSVSFRYQPSGALDFDGYDHRNSDRSYFESTSKTCPWPFFFVTHDDLDASKHPEGSTHTSALAKPLKRGERTTFRYIYHLCGRYGSAELYHQHDKREPEQRVSGMEMGWHP